MAKHESGQKLNRPDRHYNQLITILGGGIGLKGIVIPTAPGIHSPFQPPSQRSLRHINKEDMRCNIRITQMMNFSQPSPKSTTPKPLNKDRILLVDDDRRHRTCLKEFLEGRGYACSEAGNGLEGLQILQKEAVSIIITDNTMPQMDGLAFIERVNHDYPHEILPIFLMTGELSGTVRLRAFQNGVNRVFEKPLDFQELGHAVDWVTKFDLPPSKTTNCTSAR